MEITDIRLTNVDNIIKAQFDGKKARFANSIGKYSTYISTWWAKNPTRRRNIGHNIAREIETNLGLEKGWLDVQHSDNSDLELDHQKKQQLRIDSKNTHNIPLLWEALIDQQKLTLTLLNNVKGQIMLLSTDPKAWSIQLIGTHSNPILNKGWGIVIEPESPLVQEEYALLKLNNGELLLRLIAYQNNEHIIVANPITGEQITIKNEQIQRADYCYLGIPPSKIIRDHQE